MLPIVLYDIPSKLPGKTWSPNPARTRFILSYKNLPFETVWVEYPDIAPTLKEIGASPNTFLDGSTLYTVPVISDPNTGAIITDSWAIAEYLDKTYPEKPIFPKGSKSLITAFDTAMNTLGSQGGDSWRFTIFRTSQILNERSLEYFIPTREADFGAKVDEWSPEGSAVRDAHWKVIEKKYYGFAKQFYDRGEGKWLIGDTFSYADIILAVRSFWFKRVYREDEWKRIASLHDGKWEKLLAEVERECNFSLPEA